MADEVVEVKPDAKPDAELPGSGALPPAMKRKYDEAITEAKNAKARAKEAEAKAAELEAYRETFKGSEQAKALEAQRQAEAADKDRSARENRERAIRDEVTHGLISQGRKLDRRGIGLVLAGAVASDSGIALDDEGHAQGVDDYLNTVFSTFGAAPAPPEPAKKAAPGLPDTKAPAGVTNQKFANVKTYAELLALGMPAVMEFHQKYPDQYTSMVAAHESGRQGHRPVPTFAR